MKVYYKKYAFIYLILLTITILINNKSFSQTLNLNSTGFGQNLSIAEDLAKNFNNETFEANPQKYTQDHLQKFLVVF